MQHTPRPWKLGNQRDVKDGLRFDLVADDGTISGKVIGAITFFNNTWSAIYPTIPEQQENIRHLDGVLKQEEK